MPKQRQTKRQAAKQRLQEQQETAARNRLLKELGRSTKTGKAKRSGQPSGVVAMPDLTYDPSRGVSHYRSMQPLPDSRPYEHPRTPVKLDDLSESERSSWELREKAAAEEIERKKKRVAPAYNKGGYQYITDGTDPSQIGSRKI